MCSSLGQAPNLTHNYQPWLKRLTPRKNTLAYFASLSVTKEKGFITLPQGANGIKLFSLSLMKTQSKLQCMSLASLSSLVYITGKGRSLPLREALKILSTYYTILLSSAPLLGSLLALPAIQIRPERHSMDKNASLLCLFVSNEEKKFYKIDTRAQCYKTFFFGNLHIPL